MKDYHQSATSLRSKDFIDPRLQALYSPGISDSNMKYFSSKQSDTLNIIHIEVPASPSCTDWMDLSEGVDSNHSTKASQIVIGSEICFINPNFHVKSLQGAPHYGGGL